MNKNDNLCIGIYSNHFVSYTLWLTRFGTTEDREDPPNTITLPVKNRTGYNKIDCNLY